MNFDFSEEQKLLAHTARDFLQKHAPLSVCREVLESTEPFSKELWSGVAQIGWLGAAVPEEYGGAGLGRLELAVVAEELGRALAPIPFAPSACLVTEALLLAGSDAQKHEHLPALASGEAIGCMAFADGAGVDTPRAGACRFGSGRLTGAKTAVVDGEAATLALVLAQGEAGPVLVLADLRDARVTRHALRPFDPSRSVANLAFEGTPAEPLGVAGEGEALAQRLLERAAVLCAFEQVGGAARAFEMTRAFCLDRHAFGRPIASFQAVKHRLADRWVEIELARSNAYYGAWALEHEVPELPLAAAAARVSASQAFRAMAEEMVQLHGGVGTTWETDCHLFYRRARHLEAWLGATAGWKHRLAELAASQLAGE